METFGPLVSQIPMPAPPRQSFTAHPCDSRAAAAPASPRLIFTQQLFLIAISGFKGFQESPGRFFFFPFSPFCVIPSLPEAQEMVGWSLSGLPWFFHLGERLQLCARFQLKYL